MLAVSLVTLAALLCVGMAPFGSAQDTAACAVGLAEACAGEMSSPRVFDVLSGFLPNGGDCDLLASEWTSVVSAERKCALEATCSGFTFSVADLQQATSRRAETLSLAELDSLSGSVGRFVHYKTARMGRIAAGPWLSFVDRTWQPLPPSITLHSGEHTSVHVQSMLAALAERRDLKVTVLARDPHVLVFDEFLSPDEVAGLIAASVQTTFEVSQVINDDESPSDGRRDWLSEAAYSEGRTSRTAYCDSASGCASHPAVVSVQARLAALTSTNVANQESLQFTAYTVGQEFQTHSDFIPLHSALPAGHRILTAFVYLRAPDAGGATAFPMLGARVEPKAGRVVLWQNALDEDAGVEHPMTVHAGEPVLAGEKLGINVWIHRGDMALSMKHGYY